MQFFHLEPSFLERELDMKFRLGVQRKWSTFERHVEVNGQWNNDIFCP